MKTRLILQPGSRGTRKLLARYGKRMVCVRYRYDERLKRRYKTVELIVDEVPWEPKPPRGGKLVNVGIRFEEAALRGRIKAAGGRWDGRKQSWRLRYEKAVELGLKNRIVDGESI
ncbi:MAG: hypothetical protein ABSC61_07400 [Anaerolineales bacterium]